jgi:hypothetical protein
MAEPGEASRELPSRAKWEKYKEEAALGGRHPDASGQEETRLLEPVSPSIVSAPDGPSHSGNRTSPPDTPGGFVNSPYARVTSDTNSPNSDCGSDFGSGGLAGDVQKRLYATSEPVSIRHGRSMGDVPALSPLSESPAMSTPLQHPPPNTPAQNDRGYFGSHLIAEELAAQLRDREE